LRKLYRCQTATQAQNSTVKNPGPVKSQEKISQKKKKKDSQKNPIYPKKNLPYIPSQPSQAKQFYQPGIL